MGEGSGVVVPDRGLSDVCPSFVLMDVQGGHAIIYTYRLLDDVKVEKLEFKKN